jgi:protein SCO1/2
MKNLKVLGLSFGLVLVMGLAGWWGVIRFRPYVFHGMVIQSPQPAPDFTLLSHQGQRFSLSDFRGKVVILDFGYTFCPDVCPTTLAEVAQAMRLLGDKAPRVQVIMITVDPERDTPAKLGEYVAHFDPRFLGASGTADEIARVAALYGIFYEKHPGSQASGYLVDHTATLTVVDQRGYVKLIFPFGTSGEDMAADLDYLLRKGGTK